MRSEVGKKEKVKDEVSEKKGESRELNNRGMTKRKMIKETERREKKTEGKIK